MYLSELPGKTTVAARARSTGIKRSASVAGNGRRYHYRFRYPLAGQQCYHINCADHFEGVYTSNELPHLFVT